MKMDGDIRVKVRTHHEQLYDDFRNAVVGDFHELFFVCASIGFQAGRRESGPRQDKFWSRTITTEEWSCYYAMALKESGFDYDSLKDDRKVIASMEEYAAGGLEILLESFLVDYVIPNTAVPKLDPSASKSLSRDLLFLMYNREGGQWT